MTESVDFALWAAALIVTLLVAGGFAVDGRRFRAKQKEQQFETAVAALRRHYDAMERLDTPDTPAQFLELALKVSRIVHDPRTAAVVERALADDPTAFDGEPASDEEGFGELMRITAQRRPDLVGAFGEAVMSAVLAFITRHPSCTRAFNDVLLTMAAAPAQEARKIVRVAERAEFSDRALRPAFG